MPKIATTKRSTLASTQPAESRGGRLREAQHSEAHQSLKSNLRELRTTSQFANNVTWVTTARVKREQCFPTGIAAMQCRCKVACL